MVTGAMKTKKKTKGVKLLITLNFPQVFDTPNIPPMSIIHTRRIHSTVGSISILLSTWGRDLGEVVTFIAV